MLVDDPDVAHVGLGLADRVEDAHAGQDLQLGRAAEVDRLAARADVGGALDDGGVVAVAGQPVGQGGAGYACAGDEDGEGRASR
ncbi:hypothetical protein GCM10020220_033170 [Nonomuraea rubra]